jgi:hypothetical protein
MRRNRSRLSAAGLVRYGLIATRLGQRSPILTNLVRRETVHIGMPTADQLLGKRVHLLEVIGRVVQPLLPIEAEPAHVFLDGFDVLGVFLRRVGVVEAEVADAGEFLGDAEVEADRLGVPDVQIPVRFRRKARVCAAVPAGLQIVGDDLTNEVEWSCRLECGQRIGHQGNTNCTWNRVPF